MLARNCQTAARERLRTFRFSVRPGQDAGAKERVGTTGRWSGVVPLQRLFEPANTFPQVALNKPEEEQRGGKVQAFVRRAVR